MAAGSTHTWHSIMYQFAEQKAWPCSSGLCPSINSKSLHLVLKCLEYVSTTHSYLLSVFFLFLFFILILICLGNQRGSKPKARSPQDPAGTLHIAIMIFLFHGPFCLWHVVLVFNSLLVSTFLFDITFERKCEWETVA